MVFRKFYRVWGYWYGGDYGGNGRFAANFPLIGYYHGDDYGHYYIDAVIPDATPDWKKSEILNRYGKNRDSHRSWKVYTGLYKNYNPWDTVVSSTKRPVATYSRNGIQCKYPKWILNKDSIDLVTGGFTLAEIRMRQEQVYSLDWNYNRADCNVGWGCNVVCTVSEWLKSGRHNWRDPANAVKYDVTYNRQFPHGYGSKGEFFVGRWDPHLSYNYFDVKYMMWGISVAGDGDNRFTQNWWSPSNDVGLKYIIWTL